MKRIYTLALTLLIGSMAFAQSGYRVGVKVEDFTLKNLQGQAVPLSSFNDAQLVVVVFTSVKCPYAKSYEARLQQLDQTYAGRGVRFVYVNAPIGLEEGTAPKAQPDDATANNLNYPYLVDEGQQLSKQFGATKAPEVFVLQNSPDGFFLRYKGAIDDNPQVESYVKERYLASALDNLLAGRSVGTSERRATGCMIKRF
ncbi:redoxin domain-containing protein [Rufibacter roseus]|uniref:Redoxin domain-containing protein n=1 Tax=Rufibacter roseus TaxID=1567108 RepID=A0ABW2DLE7_9BACT|nr:redoxin domain-containing protein [Rufibacter roseus]